MHLPNGASGDAQIISEHGIYTKNPVYEYAKSNPQEKEECPCADIRKTQQETSYEPCPKEGGYPIKDGHVKDLGTSQFVYDSIRSYHVNFLFYITDM